MIFTTGRRRVPTCIHTRVAFAGKGHRHKHRGVALGNIGGVRKRGVERSGGRLFGDGDGRVHGRVEHGSKVRVRRVGGGVQEVDRRRLARAVAVVLDHELRGGAACRRRHPRGLLVRHVGAVEGLAARALRVEARVGEVLARGGAQVHDRVAGGQRGQGACEATVAVCLDRPQAGGVGVDTGEEGCEGGNGPEARTVLAQRGAAQRARRVARGEPTVRGDARVDTHFEARLGHEAGPPAAVDRRAGRARGARHALAGARAGGRAASDAHFV